MAEQKHVTLNWQSCHAVKYSQASSPGWQYVFVYRRGGGLGWLEAAPALSFIEAASRSEP